MDEDEAVDWEGGGPKMSGHVDFSCCNVIPICKHSQLLEFEKPCANLDIYV